MIWGFLIALGAGSFWTLSGIMNSCCARFKLSIITYLFSNVFCSFLLSLIFRVQYGSFTTATWTAAGILFFAGFLNTGGALLLQHALTRGHHGIIFLISQSAIVFPFLAGLIFFGERPSFVRILGCIGIFSGMVCCSLPKLLNGKQEKQTSSRQWLGIALLSFFSFGMAQVLMTLPSWKGLNDPAQIRTAALYAGGTFMMGLYASVAGQGKFSFSRILILCGIVVSVLNLFSMALMFRALDILAEYSLSAVGFPLAIASSMAGFTLYSLLILKEKCYFSVLTGLLLITAGGILIAV